MNRLRLILFLFAALLLLGGCAGTPTSPGGLSIRQALVPANTHGRLVNRTMRPRYLTIHCTENRGGTADMHARLLLNKGIRSKNNPRFGRSGWVIWHYTVDDREAVQHMLPTEQGDQADYGGVGDRESIGIEIAEFSDPSRQRASVENAAKLAGMLARQYGIPRDHIVPHMHWPRWDYPAGKPCPRLMLERDPNTRGRMRLSAKWTAFLQRVEHYR